MSYLLVIFGDILVHIDCAFNYCAVCLLSRPFTGLFCSFRLLILCWLPFCRYLFPSCDWPFYFFYGVIWWIYAYDFNSPIYQSISFYKVCTFYALFKKSFCPLTPWVIKIFFSKSLSVFPFLFEFFNLLGKYCICCKGDIQFQIFHMDS